MSLSVTDVLVSRDSVTLEVDESLTLTASINPVNAPNKNVTWSSSNTSVVAVSESGELVGVSVGNAVVTVTTEDGGLTSSAQVAK